MKKLSFLLSFVFVLCLTTGISAQSCAKKCTKTCSKSAKTAAVSADADQAQVASVSLERAVESKDAKACNPSDCKTMSLEECAKKNGMTVEECAKVCSKKNSKIAELEDNSKIKASAQTKVQKVAKRERVAKAAARM